MEEQEIQSELEAGKEFKELVFPKEYGIGRSFVGGDENGKRLRVKYFINKGNKQFCAKVFFGELAQGPPSHAHGGSMAAVLDEAMGLGAWAAGYSVVAAKITVEYLKMLPLNSVVSVEVMVDRVEGRKVWMKASIINNDNSIISKSEGLYIIVPDDKLGNNDLHKKLMEQIVG